MNVYIAVSRIIPARSAGYVVLRISLIESKNIPPGEGLLVAGERFVENSEGHPVLCAVVKADAQGHTITSILNSGDDKLQVVGGTFFGTFHPRLDSDSSIEQISAL